MLSQHIIWRENFEPLGNSDSDTYFFLWVDAALIIWSFGGFFRLCTVRRWVVFFRHRFVSRTFRVCHQVFGLICCIWKQTNMWAWSWCYMAQVFIFHAGFLWSTWHQWLKGHLTQLPSLSEVPLKGAGLSKIQLPTGISCTLSYNIHSSENATNANPTS